MRHLGNTHESRQVSAPLKLLRFCWMPKNLCFSNILGLPTFDIYQEVISPNCFKNRKNSSCPDFFQKKLFLDVRSEIHFVRRNMVSTGHFVIKNNYIQVCFFNLSFSRMFFFFVLNVTFRRSYTYFNHS